LEVEGDFNFSFATKSSTLKYSNIVINTGITINLKRRMNIEIYAYYNHFIHGDNFLMPKFSLVYLIGNNNNNNTKTVHNDKTNQLVPINNKNLQNKNEDGKIFSLFNIGSSLTYTNYANVTDYPTGEHLYKEFTWNINLATNISKRVNLGIQVLNIYTSGTHIDNSNYLIYGLFSQYNFLGGKKTPTKLFIEGSINKGNYYTGGTLDPYLKEGLYYVGCGMGLDIPLRNISKNLFLDVAFMNYWILNDIFDKYNYTQYIIGLNYYIGKRVHKL